uniref:Uncharacterized protein n=1 Tax=Panagrellus redivivus TaxID=6233 RepID=A0A7E4UZ12_PANRE
MPRPRPKFVPIRKLRETGAGPHLETGPQGPRASDSCPQASICRSRAAQPHRRRGRLRTERGSLPARAAIVFAAPRRERRRGLPIFIDFYFHMYIAVGRPISLRPSPSPCRHPLFRPDCNEADRPQLPSERDQFVSPLRTC